MNADGTGQTRLGPDCSGIEPPGCEDRSQGTWSRDGTTIAMSRAWGDVQHDQIKHSEVYLVDSTGKNLRRLTHFTDRPYSADVGHGRWSPDGKRLLVEVHNNPQLGTPKGRKAIFVINGPRTTLLTASFSPDGRRITFAKSGVGGQPDIVTMRLDGNDIRPVTRTPLWASQPDWGPASG
jgi:Tol biopolymer transport system component